MKYFSYYTVIFLLLITLLVFLNPNSFTYPSYGEDCKGHHGITYISIPYDKDAKIILDGKKTEDFWNNSDNKAGFIRIPTAPIVSIPGITNITVNMTFIRNDNEFLILCEWMDNTTRPDGEDIYDGIYFCWNINVPNFSPYFIGGMWTNPMGGGDIDSWGWSVDSSSYECEDNCIRTYGWYDPGHGTDNDDDLNIGFTYIINTSYTLEIKRNLVTDEEIFDVQFNDKKLYEFNIAVINDSSLDAHTISWIYALDLRDSTSGNGNKDEENSKKTKLNFGFLIIIFITSIISLIILVMVYLKKRVK